MKKKPLHIHKIVLLLILYIFSHHAVYTQDLMEVPDRDIQDMLDHANQCGGDDCEKLFSDIIHLGKKRKVDYLEYLYYNLCHYYYKTNDFEKALLIIDSISPLCRIDIVKDAFLNNKAGILYHQGESIKAIDIYIDLAKRLEAREEYQKLIYTYINISTLLYSQNNFKSGLDYSLKAYQIALNTRDSTTLFLVQTDIGDTYMDLKDYDHAKAWLYKAIHMPEHLQDVFSQAKAYRALSRLYVQSDHDSSLFFIKKSLDILKKTNDYTELANTYHSYADALIKSGRQSEAQHYIEESVRYSQLSGSLPILANNLFKAGAVSHENGLYKKAAEYLYEAKVLGDSLKSENNFKAISELATRYETEKKERQIAEAQLIIQNKNVQIRNWLILGILVSGSLIAYFFFMKHRQKTRIKVMEKEKEKDLLQAKIEGEEIERERISKELHDGVASSLLVTRLQLERDQGGSRAKAMDMLQDIHIEVRNIAHKLAPIDFSEKNWIEEVEAFCNNIHSETTQLHFFSNIESVQPTHPTHLLVLFRGLQELLQNAAKHAQAKNISIQIVRENNSILISIEDDGIGADQAVLDEADSLNKLRKRLRDINATLTIESDINAGTMAHIAYMVNFEENASGY